MAIKLADTARPNNHVDSEHLGTFPVAYAEDVWFEDGTRLSEKTFDGESIQKTELPLASATMEDKIYQYVGETGTYINGCFYKCVETSTNNYAWKQINVIDNPVRSIDDDIYSHIGEYEEGAVIVYTGADTPSYQKGHHYKKIVRGSVPTYYVDVYQDSEHQTTTPYQCLEPVVEVGTVLFYTDYNSGFVPQCKCTAISGDEYTWYRYNDGLTMKSLYGVHVNTNTTSNLLTYWDDIGGGGGGGSSEFIGTQAEWDALSSSQKDKYDGKIVNITDDGDSSTGDIAEILDPFTVNANKSAGSLEEEACKQGRIVQFKVYIESLKNIVESEWNTLGTVAQTIKPVMETPVSLSAGVVANVTAYARITTNGELQIWGSTDLNTLSSRFFATYFSAN